VILRIKTLRLKKKEPVKGMVIHRFRRFKDIWPGFVIFVLLVVSFLTTKVHQGREGRQRFSEQMPF